MKKEAKEQVVAELTERLRAAETLLVADYRGLTMPQIDALRSRLIESGATFTVVKNTLTRRAAEAAGADALLTLLEVLRGQVIGAIIAPVSALAGLVNAPLQNLYGLIDARIEQLGGAEEAPEQAAEPVAEQAAEPEAAAEAPAAEADEGAESAEP